MTTTLAKAMLAAQKAMPAIQKTAINPHFQNRYIPLESLVAAVLPVLNEHGITLSQQPCIIEGKPALRTRFTMAETGESDEEVMLLMLEKDNAQGQGSAITYARRQALAAMLGIAAEPDDDGNAASRPTSRGEADNPGSAQPTAGAKSTAPTFKARFIDAVQKLSGCEKSQLGDKCREFAAAWGAPPLPLSPDSEYLQLARSAESALVLGAEWNGWIEAIKSSRETLKEIDKGINKEANNG